MMNTDLVGRVERIRLTPRNALFPLFEAVSNSIDAIRARKDGKKGVVEVRLSRDSANPQLVLQGENIEPISEIRITDNGVGFTPDNMTAFQNLDTRFKIAIGGKGVGRLTWLKVFEKATVSSVYRDSSGYRKRAFDFLLPDGVENESDTPINDKSGSETATTIILFRPKDAYYEMARHRTETIAASLEKHFLYYLLDSVPLEIKVIDGQTTVPLQTNNVTAREAGHFTINKHNFDIEHLKIHSPQKAQHTVNFCANHRPVREERLKQLPERKFDDGGDGFFYQAYVSSPYLDSCVDEQRTTLVLEEGPSLFGVSEKELHDQVNAVADQYLSKELDALREEREKRIDRIIEENVPQLGYVKYFNREELEAKVTYNNSDADIESIIGDIHLKNQKTGRALMDGLVKDLKDSVKLDLKSFEATFADRIKKITGPNEANLASYVLYRRSIIDLYREVLLKSGNSFEKEAAVHKLMFPMGEDLDTSKSFLNHNLWLLDERLTFANYVASDLPISKHRMLFEVDSKREPDIVCYYNFGFSEDDPALDELHNVVIVELKRPGPHAQRPETPWDQTMDYIKKIREGFYEDRRGQKVKASESTKFYCFIVCDTDDQKIQSMIERDQFQPIYGGVEGYSLYHLKYQAYVELVPFQKILRDAERKHRAFFERIGLIQGK